MQTMLIINISSTRNIVILLFVHHLLACCSGAGSEGLVDWHKYISYVNGTSVNASAVDLLEKTQSRSFLHCCTLCHMADGCRGVAYAERECRLITLINGTAAGFRICEGDCNTGHYKLVLLDDQQKDDGAGKFT